MSMLANIYRRTLSVILSLVLAFAWTLGVAGPPLRQALADGNQIIAIAIYYEVAEGTWGTPASSTAPTDHISVSLSSKGEQLELHDYATWNDFSYTWDNGTNYVTWKSSDENVVGVTVDGVITAKGNGSATITCTVNADKAGGETVEAVLYVEVTGQDGRYVTGIQIAGPDGNPLGTAAYVTQEDRSTLTIQFYALLDVYDVATGTTQTYSTRDGLPSDIGAVVWSTGGSNIGQVDPDSGLYRPAKYGQCMLYASTYATIDGKELRATGTVNCADPEGQAQDGYYPQDTLTIKAYYKDYPPADLNDDSDSHWVVNRTYTVEELADIGTTGPITYTALGDSSWLTMTGDGVLLASLLKDVGISYTDVLKFAFGTEDELDREVSAEYVFEKDRFYYPNADIGSTAGAVQVAPIIAITSNQRVGGSCEPDYNMDESFRFRLLFGANAKYGSNSSYQIKWINTLYVVLDKAPEYEPGDGDGQGGSGGEGSGGGSGDGTGTGSGSGSTTGSSRGSATNVGPTAATDGGGEETGADADTSGGADGGGSYRIYQVMNNSKSDVDVHYDDENPFQPWELPFALLLLAIGAGCAVVWSKRQSKETPVRKVSA